MTSTLTSTSWQELANDAATCTRCDLYARATQTVFGEGPPGAPITWHGLVVSTIHPSAVLRGPDAESRDRAYAGLVEDLMVAWDTAARLAAR